MELEHRARGGGEPPTTDEGAALAVARAKEAEDRGEELLGEVVGVVLASHGDGSNEVLRRREDGGRGRRQRLRAHRSVMLLHEDGGGGPPPSGNRSTVGTPSEAIHKYIVQSINTHAHIKWYQQIYCPIHNLQQIIQHTTYKKYT
jgi:hypothetical protein